MGKRSTESTSSVCSQSACWCAQQRCPVWPPPCTVTATDLEEGRVLAAGFAGGRAGREQGDPGATASQGHQGHCPEAPEDMWPRETDAPSIAEKLTSCPGAARVKSNFQTQVDDCPTDPKPRQGQCRQISLLSPGHGFPSRAPSCAPSLGCSGRDGSLVTQEIALLGTFFKNDMFSRKHFRGKVLP